MSFAKLIAESGSKKKPNRTEIAVPVIDGTPLFALMQDRFPGVATNLLVDGRHLLGAPLYGEDGRAVLLDGTCGHAGCCGVMARVEVTTERVIWTDFFARGAPELPAGLRFEFDRRQYEEALSSIRDIPLLDPSAWPDGWPRRGGLRG